MPRLIDHTYLISARMRNFAFDEMTKFSKGTSDKKNRLRDTHALARRLREYWKYEPTFFLAKNKNEDSDLGWTADLKNKLR